LNNFGAKVGQIGRSLALVGTAVVAALGGAGKLFAATGDKLEKMSRRTGFTVEQLSALNFVASQNSVSLDQLAKSIKKMQQNIVNANNGLSTQVREFDKLGISMEALEGLNPVQQFARIGSAIQKVEDPTKRAGIAVNLFGRQAEAMLQIFSDAATPIDQLIARAQELGIIIDGKAAKSAVALTDAMDELLSVIKITIFNIGGAVAPIFTEMAKSFTDAAVNVGNWVRENKGLVVGLLKMGGAVLGVGAALITFSVAIKGVAFALGGAAAAIGVMKVALTGLTAAFTLLLSPIGIAVTALGFFAAEMVITSDRGQRAFEDLGDTVNQTIKGISDAMATGDITRATEILWASIKLLWLQGTGELRRIWEEFEFFIQSNFLGALESGADALAGVFESTFNGILALARTTVRLTLNAIVGLVRAAESIVSKLPGYETITGGANVSGALDNIGEKITQEFLAPIKIERQGIGLVELERIERDQNLANVERNIRDARRELDNLTSEAGAKRTARDLVSEFENVLPGGLSFKTGGLSDEAKKLTNAFEGAGDQIKQQIQEAQETRGEAVGGFRLSNLSALGLGSSVQEQQLAALKNIEKSSKRTEDNTREGGIILT
jgi:hypothetical protein